MDNPFNKLRMILVVVGFLFVVTVIIIINRFMAQGISETENQIKYFQSQSGIK